MKRKQLYRIITGILMMFMMGSAGSNVFGAEYKSDAFAAGMAEGPGGTTAAFRIGQMKAAKDAEKLILVIGQGGSQVTVSYHTKGVNGVWNTEFTTPGVCGRNAMTYDKKEGDGKTPCGTFGFNLAFGIQEDPGSVLPYHKVTPNDYWVDDENSQYYNQLVDASQVKKDWNSAEKLINIAPYYDYGLSLTYNEACVPGKGSAIFLHCTTPEYKGSGGCICIPTDRMVQLLKSVDAKTKIVIVSEKNQLKDQ